ncbi:MAG: indolepyruvate oxidoreductase subunit beta [Lachnospiraceae bacterium]|nr:indolepyruvate oxidoreductase subunit beta [Lachnospiraceae bacterium]
MNRNIILSGVGGQGTILASRLIAAAAMEKGYPILAAETIGMAQRGGSVFSHLRIGENLHSPLIARGQADLIIGFEPGETVRQLPFLSEGGTVVVSSRPVMPVSASIGLSSYDSEEMISYLRAHTADPVIVDTAALAEDLGSVKVLNVALLSAAARSGALGFTEADLEEAIRRTVPERFLDLNLRALRWGSGTF